MTYWYHILQFYVLMNCTLSKVRPDFRCTTLKSVQASLQNRSLRAVIAHFLRLDRIFAAQP